MNLSLLFSANKKLFQLLNTHILTFGTVKAPSQLIKYQKWIQGIFRPHCNPNEVIQLILTE